MAAYHSSPPRSTYVAQWLKWRANSHLYRAVANELGTSFLNMSELYATRPDMHMGSYRRWNKGAPMDNQSLDCVHFCMPGPTDELATLVFNVLSTVVLRPSARRVVATHGQRQ